MILSGLKTYRWMGGKAQSTVMQNVICKQQTAAIP